MESEYKVNHPITPNQYIELVNKTALGERRPTENETIIRHA